MSQIGIFQNTLFVHREKDINKSYCGVSRLKNIGWEIHKVSIYPQVVLTKSPSSQFISAQGGCRSSSGFGYFDDSMFNYQQFLYQRSLLHIKTTLPVTSYNPYKEFLVIQSTFVVYAAPVFFNWWKNHPSQSRQKKVSVFVNGRTTKKGGGG